MFLVPASILFGALGVATTELLKTGISAMGLATSAVWFIRVWLWTGLEEIDRITILVLAGIFVAAWFCTLVTHIRLWIVEYRASAPTPPMREASQA